jgi:hypothetical protein
VQGRRLPDASPQHQAHADRFERGDYQVAGSGRRLWVCLPDGAFGILDERWTWSEDAAGALTVEPSIHHEGGWHGWLRAGVWESV